MKRIGLVLVAVLAFVTYLSVFVIYEGQRGIKVRFSAVLKNSEGGTVVYEPGLNFKVPFIDKIKILDARIQTLDGEPDRFVTSEKKDLIVDSYVKWRIKDFETYYLATGGGHKFSAENLLKQKVSDALRNQFGTRTIKEIVTGESEDTTNTVNQRDELMSQALATASEKSQDLGIELIDIRIKQIELPQAVRSSIYQRMRAERIVVAKEHRATGQKDAEVIRAGVDAKVTIMIATAQSNALVTRGEGDAAAAKIYAESYGQDPEFFSFLRSMESYQKSFNSKNDILVVKPDSEFFKYLNNPNAQ